MTHTEPFAREAPEHRKAVRDFFYHLVVFVFVSALLVIVDVRAGTAGNAVVGLDWAYWVILFWGLGLAGHAVYAFLGDHRR
jgi:2TM domain